MSDMNDRLQKARRDAGFETATDAARFYGWNENTYRSHENGERGLRLDAASRYARAFKVDAGWLLAGTGGHTLARPRLPLIGRVAAGGSIDTSTEQEDPNVSYEAELLVNIPGAVATYEVQGQSMWPKYEADTLIVAEDHRTDTAGLDGQEVVCMTADGSRLLKVLRTTADPERYDLESHNAPPIRGVQLQWVAEVAAIIPAKKWRKIEVMARQAQRAEPVNTKSPYRARKA